jgi:DNA topoisomerase-3
VLGDKLKILLESRKIGPLEGFRSKTVKIYVEKLILDEHGGIQFVFLNNRELESVEELTLERLKTYLILGKCCCCGSYVHVTEGAYVCENFVDGEKCRLHLGRHILDQPMDDTPAKNDLRRGKAIY